MVELLLVRTSPHEEYSKLNGILRLAQLHRPNSGMSDDVARVRMAVAGHGATMISDGGERTRSALA